METLFLDTETTGLRGIYADGEDEVVELAILADDGLPVVNQLVRPANKIEWPQAERIHGISPEMVRNAPTLIELLPDLAKLVSGNCVVIYNAQFDMQFFPKGFFSDCEVECAMLRYASWKAEWNHTYGNYRWHKLVAAAKDTGFSEDLQWHRALADTIACRHVWHYLLSANDSSNEDFNSKA